LLDIPKLFHRSTFPIPSKGESVSASIGPAPIADLERIEMTAWGDFYKAASSASISSCGLQITESYGAIVGLAAGADVLALNSVVGLGLEGSVSPTALDQLIARYTDAGVPRFFVQVSPMAEAGHLPRLLADRGFVHHNNWVKLHRNVAPVSNASTDLNVRQIAGGEAAAFGRNVAECFGWPEAAGGWVADLVGRSGWRHYAAFDGHTPVATGSLYTREEYAWVDFATTLPDYRGRGAQSAILAQRIADAAELGCHTVAVETAEETPEKPAPSYRNMVRYGFGQSYIRPNYIYVAEGSSR
jgi:GNAT superfamily N-acetyltransferase